MHEFGPFRYDDAQRLLFRGEDKVALQPKAIDTLHALIERRGQVVEKAELLRLVWPDTTVEEIGLTRNISLLRKALGDDAYIETIPRRGYRFMAQPAARKPRSGWALAVGVAAVVVAAIAIIYWQFYRPSKYVATAPGAPSLAVVPFEWVGPDPDPAAAQAVSELLVTELAKTGAITVIGPSTVRRYQRAGSSMAFMGRLLGLDVLVEGTAQRSGERVVIAPRLVDVHTGRLIWADRYEAPSANWDRAETAGKMAAAVAGHLAIHGGFPPRSVR